MQLPARAAAAPLLDAKGKRLKLGMDNFAVRACGVGRAVSCVDYAAGLKLDTLFTDRLPGLGSLKVECRAPSAAGTPPTGIEIQLGAWSVCPTSKVCKNDWGRRRGTPRRWGSTGQGVGSDVFRAVLGAREDRQDPGGIEARIADTVKVLQSQRQPARWIPASK
jgi:hypothetical protein